MHNHETLIRDHLDALNSGDIPSIMAHYHSEAFIIHQQGLARGDAELKGMFEFFTQNVLISGQTEFTLISIMVEDDIVYIVWSAESPTFSVALATDTFVIADGLITKQTTAGVMNPKS